MAAVPLATGWHSPDVGKESLVYQPDAETGMSLGDSSPITNWI